jgi:hypothetical protein
LDSILTGVLTLEKRGAKFAVWGWLRLAMDDDAAQFVCDLNVKRFAEKLRSERDADMRMSLKKLLVEEEDKFGRRTERVRNIERYIAEGSRRIASQNSLIEKLKVNGPRRSITWNNSYQPS